MTTVLDTNTKLENTKDTMDINQIYYTGDAFTSIMEDIVQDRKVFQRHENI